MHEVGHGLPVTGQDGVDEEIGGAEHRFVEVQPVGQVKGVEGFFVGVDDAAGTRVGASDGDLTTVSGRVRLLGEERKDIILFSRGDADQPSWW